LGRELQSRPAWPKSKTLFKITKAKQAGVVTYSVECIESPKFKSQYHPSTPQKKKKTKTKTMQQYPWFNRGNRNELFCMW
jgi:hypothetical protein